MDSRNLRVTKRARSSISCSDNLFTSTSNSSKSSDFFSSAIFPFVRNYQIPAFLLKSVEHQLRTHSLINVGDLLYPFQPGTMIHGKNLIRLPMEEISNIGYLFTDLIRRVANHSPPGAAKSTSKGSPQCGQAYFLFVVPLSLIVR